MKIPNACEINVNGNETEMTKLIAQYGPVACAMAITEGFTSYKSGVFYDPQCSKRLEHAVVSCNSSVNAKFTNKSISILKDFSWIWDRQEIRRLLYN